MTYGDTTRARSLAGNPSTGNVSSADVTQAVAYGDSMVNTFTGYDAWNSTDDPDFYPSIQTASEFFASSQIRERFDDPGKKAQSHYERAMAICDGVRRSSSHNAISVSSNYHSWPANENAGPYQSNVPLWTNSDGSTGDPGDV